MGIAVGFIFLLVGVGAMLWFMKRHRHGSVQVVAKGRMGVRTRDQVMREAEDVRARRARLAPPVPASALGAEAVPDGPDRVSTVDGTVLMSPVLEELLGRDKAGDPNRTQVMNAVGNAPPPQVVYIQNGGDTVLMPAVREKVGG